GPVVSRLRPPSRVLVRRGYPNTPGRPPGSRWFSGIGHGRKTPSGGVLPPPARRPACGPPSLVRLLDEEHPHLALLGLERQPGLLRHVLEHRVRFVVCLPVDDLAAGAGADVPVPAHPLLRVELAFVD